MKCYNRQDMIIKKLTITNHRNYSSEIIELDKGLNIFSGANAMGKTNLLESIYLAGIGKSPRTIKDKELIKWGADHLYIKAEVARKYSEHRIEFYITNNSKRIAINGMAILKMGELMGALNIIFFSPDELKMVKESPKERRRYMDISLSQQKKSYFYILQRYNQILDQRNKLLKTTNNMKELIDMVSIWDIQLAESGADIILNRHAFAESLNIYASRSHSFLTDGKELLNVEYETKSKSKNRDELVKELKKMLAQNLTKDYNMRYTTEGPHRDDIKLLINDKDVRKYGSQGQQRTTALALKLAEIDYFKEVTGETPILLLDDVLSELDIYRQKQLIECTAGVQTILTCTDYNLKTPVPYKEFRVKNGKILNI